MTAQMQRIVLASRPKAAPQPENFRFETAPIPVPGAGQMLVRVIWLSLDPYMRGRMDDGASYAQPVPIGGVMEGGAVGQIVASNIGGFKVGEFVNGPFGWQSHAISDGTKVRKLDPALAPISTAVGVLGMPGITAFVGLNDHGRPKAGETLVVSAATGAVGSLVGQLGKAYGLRVVGVAGGADKCAYAVEELGFDACLDHRAAGDARALRAQMTEACPKGVDIYFENVGGKTLEAVIPLMNVHGRIPICGMISWYNSGGLGAGASEGANLLPQVWRNILVKRLSLRGFIISDHYDRFPDFVKEVSGHIRDGRVKYRESVAEGLAAAPEAFMKLLQGGNFGKQLVRISDDPTR
ncbi:MAG: NADP-dependent oxidoreductase [Rhodobacterales bacterium]|jgi:NADPH-dependent curcumin reductase|nr:NADP-dependent oxidoreductase [Pseudomonadota bacterium]MDA1287099.1 NADP-dependent oxidoreductase [Pseudomonadota bacterium]HBN30065.1 NADP-dependent oxidoreductase [Paracoccaceae bacterium]